MFGRQSSYTNQLGVVSTWRYDSKGNVTEWIEAKGLPEQRTTLYSYDPYSQLTCTTKGAGNAKQTDAITQSWQYDSAGNVTAQTDGEGNTRKMAYDLRGAPTSRTDALNRTTSFNIDAAGNLTKATNPLGNATQMRYDARGRRTHTTSPMGNTQIARYDEKGRVVEILAPGETEGAGRRTVYDSNGWPIQSISPSGLITETTYDERGRIKASKDPAGNVTRYEYGEDGTTQAGQLLATQYPTYKETYQYDQQGRQTAVTQHLGGNETRTQSQAYDALGQRVASIDPAGRTTLTQYDALGRNIETTDPAGQNTKQGWNVHDQLITATDANENTHIFEFDRASKITKETRPMGGAISYIYDAEGQLKRRVDAGGGVRTYEYSIEGQRVNEVHYPSSNEVDQKIIYKYNLNGDLIFYEQNKDDGGLISGATYIKDAQSRTVESQIKYGNIKNLDNFSFSIKKKFNTDGLLESYTYPEGSESKYVYKNGRLASVKFPNNSEITFDRYQWGSPTLISMPGVIKNITLDSLQRSLSIEVKNDNEIIASRRYQYDVASNISQVVSELGEVKYKYDNLDRLTGSQPETNLRGIGLPVEMYEYDTVHNRTKSLHQQGLWSYYADNQIIR